MGETEQLAIQYCSPGVYYQSLRRFSLNLCCSLLLCRPLAVISFTLVEFVMMKMSKITSWTVKKSLNSNVDIANMCRMRFGASVVVVVLCDCVCL